MKLIINLKYTIKTFSLITIIILGNAWAEKAPTIGTCQDQAINIDPQSARITCEQSIISGLVEKGKKITEATANAEVQLRLFGTF